MALKELIVRLGNLFRVFFCRHVGNVAEERELGGRYEPQGGTRGFPGVPCFPRASGESAPVLRWSFGIWMD